MKALSQLGTTAPADFVAFYSRYEGPFNSDHTAFMLLDLIRDDTNICSQTQACRLSQGFLPRHWVLTDLVGDGVLVLDAESDQVFSIDFEGSDLELLAGTLQPQWPSFADFLKSYFGPSLGTTTNTSSAVRNER